VRTIKKPTHVLLIDDEQKQFLLIGYLLSEANYDDYRLTWCENLDDGLYHIEHYPCDVVLLDYHWGLTSKDFMTRAQLVNGRIPIIVMTEGMERDVDRKAISEGASDYLIKDSINPEILERTIRYSIERKKNEQHLDHLAHYDHLTDLPNRMLFLDRLNQAISLGDRSNDQFTLMYLDLNSFKAVNDNYGHETGDKLLQSFSRRLQSCIRRSDTVARIGGDEFTILLNNIGSTSKIISLAKKLIENIQIPFHINGVEFSIGCSIGIAVFPEAGRDADILQRHADIAMYQAKQSTSSSSYQFFSHQYRQRCKTIENISSSELKSLIDDNKVTLGFTPRVNVNSNSICTVEVTPMYLSTNMMAYINNNDAKQMLNEWMIEKALESSRLIDTKSLPVFCFCIDYRQLQSSQFAFFTKNIVKKYNIPIENIELCLLNSDELKNSTITEECIVSVNNLGARFALNEYGGNTLSLININQYNTPTLYLQSSLLQLALKNNKALNLASALIFLAHRLHCKVVASNITTSESLARIKKLGVDEFKGKLLGSHLSIEHLNNCFNSAVT